MKLGGQPFETLAVLLNRPGQLVTREELQKEIWAADTFVDFNHGLNAAVNKLREKLSDCAEEAAAAERVPVYCQDRECAERIKARRSHARPKGIRCAAPPKPTPAEREGTAKLGHLWTS